jgi:Ca2+-dependent lipid-binding protein
MVGYKTDKEIDMAGRTITITHLGRTVTVKEGYNNKCVLQFRDHTEETTKKFPAAARYALKWMLENAGEMRGNYER